MPPYRPIRERLLAKTEITENCWIWLGAKRPGGYGVIGGERNGVVLSVHRVAYELFKGPIPVGLHIDHLCRNRSCVNPDHLEAVTQRENNLRAAATRWGKPRKGIEDV